MLELSGILWSHPPVETELGPITPIVHVENSGDEGMNVTGLARVYRISTGLQVYDSVLTPTTVAAGATAEIPALTPWLPPAPAADDYFVSGWLNGTSTGCTKVPWSGNIPALTFDITAPPPGPYPDPHAPTHEDGGSDPLDLLDLDGYTGDPADFLRGDATWGPAGDGPAVFWEDEFLRGIAGYYTYPWRMVALAGGTFANLAGLASHPGIIRISSSTSANSGYLYTTAATCIIVAGTETAEFIFRPQTLLGSVFRCGFIDSTSPAPPVDGVYIEMDQVAAVDGVIVGKTASNSVRSTTATNFTLVTNTWYRLVAELNADATLATFTLYSEAGAVLWTDTLAATIPTAAGRETGHGFILFNTLTSAVILGDMDHQSLGISRALVR